MPSSWFVYGGVGIIYAGRLSWFCDMDIAWGVCLSVIVRKTADFVDIVSFTITVFVASIVLETAVTEFALKVVQFGGNLMSFTSRVGKFFGGRFAPDNTVVPVMRYEQFHRLAGPGIFHIKPMMETTLEPVSLGIRIGEFKFEDVLSHDNIPFSMRMTVLFKFDPEATHEKMLPQLVRLSPRILEDIVKKYANRGVRRLAARFDAEELCNEQPMQTIERDLTRFLRANLAALGLAPLPTDGILIQEMVAPYKFQQTMLAIRQHKATLEVLQGYQEAQLVDQALRAQFLAGLEHHEGNLTVLSALEGGMFPNMLDMLRTTQTAVSEPNEQQNGWGNGRTRPKSNLPPAPTTMA